ncbi:hypothetical protein [Aliidiomarina quisquiliarum]|nr:hypothetical protein [Aliidiomarina quisquiliarum]MCO4322377.1 hypothetical protein [Aliidiomarina quisquiliarum]
MFTYLIKFMVLVILLANTPKWLGAIIFIAAMVIEIKMGLKLGIAQSKE